MLSATRWEGLGVSHSRCAGLLEWPTARTSGLPGCPSSLLFRTPAGVISHLGTHKHSHLAHFSLQAGAPNAHTAQPSHTTGGVEHSVKGSLVEREEVWNRGEACVCPSGVHLGFLSLCLRKGCVGCEGVQSGNLTRSQKTGISQSRPVN